MVYQITDSEFAAAVKAARSQSNLMNRLGLSHTHWWKVKERLKDFDHSHFSSKKSWSQKTDDEFREGVRASWSLASLRVRLGYKMSGTLFERLRQRMTKLGLSKADFCAPPPRARHGARPLARQKVFRKTKGRANGSTLRDALLRAGRPYRCAECGLTDTWNGRRLSLHVDHINGDNTDHQFENLRFLCPNCHSQTPTYCGRNLKTPRPMRAEQIMAMDETLH